jgi:hypothetical protein
MFDIIGDIHGHVSALENLLQKLGYVRRNGVYAHDEGRKIAFLGDFIDRGPKIRETLHLVKNMCDAGNAIAVMGNHEYNAICFHTPHIEKGGFFRDHSLKEIEQHIETLRQFKHHESEWPVFLEWFKTLPLYYENDDFRMVHACWDNEYINWIKNNYKGISNEFLSRAYEKENIEYAVVEETLKGKETKLPEGLSFSDKDGAVRYECRIKWWSDKRKTFGEVMMLCPESIAHKEIPPNTLYHSYNDDKPVFFGHYWLKGNPMIENPNAICLDYSIAKGGLLVACRLTQKNGKLETSFIF